MIFFLDFDGVVNNTRVSVSKPEGQSHNMFGWIDPISVGLINKWSSHIERYYKDEVEVVITSTWRSSIPTASAAQMILGTMGLSMFVHKDHRTRPTGMTINGKTDIRGYQIRDWLDDHPDETKWIIIDDDDDFTSEQKERLVQTDTYNGVLLKHHIRAEEIIGQLYTKDNIEITQGTTHG